MVTSVDHPTIGPLKTLGLPVKFSATPGSVNQAAPLLGQHSREVLREHGFQEGDIEELIRQGVVGISPESA
jgi:crotonobetainyl-CoA:carnitine CoA-transferase CaiB-like acyl-CoA transferase